MRNFIWEICHNPGIKSKMVVLLYRLATLHTKHNVIFFPITFCFVILNKIINEVIIGVEIPYQTRIGKCFRIWHAHAIVINKDCIIGDFFNIRQSCTLGANKKSYPDRFVIGNNVTMGAHSCILSDDITVGNNVIIGAGVVLMENIPAEHYVIGSKPIVKKLKNF
ncbi:serine acetyltransferase [Klebsiella quasipneumoniae]|uniref:serine acetyltransferase n=1 Tax=Klebsiella quasipneumoniae TaxID=1463165 RepID=UPI002730649C|nr:serine acetyltransferase [Klebsiella quasipneumoniae]MDP1296228.1 serine acetyltransferase [Klebsiella quasipneumoniae]